MNFPLKDFSLKDFSLKNLSLKDFSLEKLSLKSKLIGLAAIVLILVLVLSLSISACNRSKAPIEETVPADTQIDATDPTTETTAETQPVSVPATMGTVTAGKLNIRKGPDSGYETDGAYFKGDRIEILETKTVDDTVWGRTSKGWIGMGYVRMDGDASPDSEGTDSAAASSIISNNEFTVLGYGVVDLGELNVRSGPGTDYDKVGTVTMGTRYAYYQLSSASGNWARIEDGWVSTDYFYIEGAAADDGFTGTVTTDDLNIRTGPNTSFRSIGSYGKDETIEILAQVGSWGYTEEGWVFVSYVEPVEPTYTTGICRVTSGLNIRKEPSPDAEIVGSYSEGDGITILEVQGNWGRTIQGWINLKYVKYD